jgi:hypothetical protein
LVALLVVVVLGWILISPRVLPPTSAPRATPGPLDGRWTLHADLPLTSTLELRGGTYQLGGNLALTGGGTATVDGSTIEFSHQSGCAGTGRYGITLAEVDRYGLLPENTSQAMALTLLEDPCAERAATLTAGSWTLRASLRDGVYGICDPPNEEAAVTGHWPEPSGCSAQ